MVKKWVRSWFSRVMRKQEAPWATLEIESFEPDGRIKLAFDFNQPFIDKVTSMGFQAETAEDTVQLFFLTAALRPMALVGGDEAVQPAEHPSLSSPQNMLVQ